MEELVHRPFLCRFDLFRLSRSLGLLIGLVVQILDCPADEGAQPVDERHQPVEQSPRAVAARAPRADVEGAGDKHTAGVPRNEGGGDGTGAFQRTGEDCGNIFRSSVQRSP